MLRYQVRALIDPSFAPQLRRMQIGKLKSIGAFSRKVMRSLFKNKTGASDPGSPPHVHTKKLKNRTLFAVDPQQLSVVTGPATADSARGQNVARILNEGGRTTVTAGFNTGKSIYVAPRNWTSPTREKTNPAIARIIKE